MSTSLGRFLVVVGLLALAVASRAQGGAASLELDFTVPSGYVARQEGGTLWLVPQTMGDVRTPCYFGFAPLRPSKGSLEADAEAALGAETVEMRRTNDYRIARRGVAAAGWPYSLSGGNFEAKTAAGFIYIAVMAMVIPASANRVSVVVGFGNAAGCAFNDVPFAQLFHGLRPRVSPSPAGNAQERDLIGTWGGSRLSGHTFLADGRYSRSSAGVLHGRTLSGEGDGRYAVRGSEVTITPRVSGQAPERFRVSIYDKWHIDRWQRAMTVLYDESGVPSVAEYVLEAR